MAKRLLKGRYEVLKRLGTSQSQKTFLALDRETQKLVVIKLLLFDAGLKWEAIKLFEREAKTLKSLAHTAIPRYLDYFDVEISSGKGFALVQSYIEATSLEAQIKAGDSFSESELKQIAKAVLEVLEYLHSRCPRIIHRDIKPSNILLANRTEHQLGYLYLVDFGSVQAAQSEGDARTVVGTYGYMPPEQFGDRAVPASDLYSLGMTLIYLAAGAHPADLPQKNLRLCFEEHVSLSIPFIRWLERMIAPALDERFGSANEALKLLVQGLNPEPSQESLPILARASATTSRKENPGRLSKPIDSKVMLVKQPDLLKIMIPPAGFSLILIPLSLIAWAANIGPLSAYIMAIRTAGLGGLIATFIYHIPGLWLLFNILFTLFGTFSLSIDSKKIHTRYQLWGLKYYRCYNVPRQHILRLERNNSSYRAPGGIGREEKKIVPQINIWAGTKKIRLSGMGVLFSRFLSEIEVDWLADELSEWLDLPITYSER